jgi:hypothetical protein
MSKHKIKFLPHNKEITVIHGENLIRAALEAGAHINASCGGEGATLLTLVYVPLFYTMFEDFKEKYNIF